MMKAAENHTTISRRELVFVILLLGATLLLRILNLDSYPVMSADGTGYALTGKNFIHSLDLRAIGTVMPPMYPFFIGLFSLLFDNLETATRLVSVCFSAMTVIPLYLLARCYFGAAVAAGAALLYTFLPFMHSMSGVDLSEPTYTFFALSGVYLAVRGMTERRRLLLLASGVFIGLAYLARPEALVLFGGLWLLFLTLILLNREERTRSRIVMLLCLTAGWLMVAVPYMVALHNITGKWQISGKVGIGIQLVKDRYGVKGAYESQFRLNKDGKGYAGGGFESPLSLLRERPDIFLANVRDNLVEFPGKVAGNVPYYLLLFAVVGMFCTPLTALFAGRLLLFVTFLPLMSYVILTFDPRYFYPYVPVLLLFVSVGVNAACGQMSRIIPARLPLALCLIALLSAYYLYQDIPRQRPPYDFNQDGGRFDDKQVGLRLKSILPPQAVLLTRSSRIGFYANRPVVIPPEAELRSSLDFARKNGVTHIVANMQLLGMRPAFEPLFQPLMAPGSVTPVPGVELVYTGQEPGGQPYLVYGLK